MEASVKTAATGGCSFVFTTSQTENCQYQPRQPSSSFLFSASFSPLHLQWLLLLSCHWLHFANWTFSVSPPIPNTHSHSHTLTVSTDCNRPGRELTLCVADVAAVAELRHCTVCPCRCHFFLPSNAAPEWVCVHRTFPWIKRLKNGTTNCPLRWLTFLCYCWRLLSLL